MKWIVSVVLIGFAFQTEAQILKTLKESAVQTGKKLNTKDNQVKVAKIGLSSTGVDKARADFDSTDFDYAILVSDNSGLFDVKEKGQLAAQFKSGSDLALAFYKDQENIQLSPVQKADMSRQMGELWYARKMFKMAEQKFIDARGQYETSKLTNELGYFKTISDQGLLFSTMGRFSQAEGFTHESLDLRREKFGENSLAVASSLNNYGVL